MEEKILLVYMEKRIDSVSSKLMHEWAEVDAHNNAGKGRRWHKQIEVDAEVGNIYQFTGTRLLHVRGARLRTI